LSPERFLRSYFFVFIYHVDKLLISVAFSLDIFCITEYILLFLISFHLNILWKTFNSFGYRKRYHVGKARQRSG
jgi:hypothetical protein